MNVGYTLQKDSPQWEQFENILEKYNAVFSISEYTL